MVLIQLLLPTRTSETDNTLKPLIETRQELTERFNGPTAYVRTPATDFGAASNSRPEKGSVALVEVVTDSFDREWWRAYARTLAERFTPGDVRWRALRLDVPDEA